MESRSAQPSVVHHCTLSEPNTEDTKANRFCMIDFDDFTF